MNAPLRVLALGDREGILPACLRALEGGGFRVLWEELDPAEGLEAALARGDWDIVLCGMDPSVLGAHGPGAGGVPLLVVAESLDEEAVSAAMRAGARDFLSWGGLERLVPAVRRVLGEGGARQGGGLGHSDGLFLENPAPMLLVDASTLLVVDANPAAAAFFGHSLELLRSASIRALSRPPQTSWMGARRAKDRQSHFFSDQMLADGQLREVDVYAVRIRQGARQLLLATLFDQTGRKGLKTSEAMLVAAVEQVAEAIAITDIEGKIVYANRSFQTLTGLVASMVKGWAVVDLLEREEIHKAIRQAALGVPWQGPVSFRKEGGGSLEADLTCSPLRIPGAGAEHLILVMRDITREAGLERGLRQSQKLEALGALAAGIAHDSNNILTTILTAAELVKWKLPPDSPLLHKLDVILQAGQCAAGLNKQILAYSQRSDEKRVPLDLSALVRDAIQMLRSTLDTGIEVQSELVSGIWVEGDPALFPQMVMNLSLNAVDAMQAKGGMLRVALTDTLVGERNPVAALATGRYALLRVQDTGCGMDRATLERVFDPFFSTKTPGDSNGLGLSLIQASVIKAGGRVMVQSEPGKGTEFCIYWPCATGQGFSLDGETAEDVSGGESLLFVEDEELVAALAKLGLQNLGYSVRTCKDPVEALEHFQMHPDDYDLVLTDLAMPKLSGVELAGKLQAIRPATPIILVSGMPLAPTLEGQARFQGFVAKPFTAHDLAASIRKTLAQVDRRAVPQVSETRGDGLQAEGALVLLAEDSHTTRSMVRMWLEEMGCQVVEARDGQEAWDIFLKGARQGPFSLVLTDVVMPRMDGLELAQLIRKSDATLPMAILTSNEDKDTLKSALNLGVNEFLNKPFERHELSVCVESLLRLSRSRQTTRRSAETAQAVRLAQKTLVAVPEKDLPLFSLFEPLTDAGGDVFRCMKCADGSILFILADVAGHSVLSSYAVASFLGMLSTQVGECISLMAQSAAPGSWDSDPVSLAHCCGHYGKIPCHPLRHLALKFNHAIQSGPFSEIPICILAGLWNPATGQLRLLNAGIPHGLLGRGEGGEVRPIEINGTPLGVFSDLAVEECEVRLQAGDRLLFGTDGFFDVLSSSNEYFQDKAADKWGELRELPIDTALSLICEEARNHGAGVIADDLLVIGFEQPPITQTEAEVVLRLPSIPRAVDMACDRLAEFISASPWGDGLDKAHLFDILLAVREALTNAIIHGNRNRPEAEVLFKCVLDMEPQELRVMVTDEGEGFSLPTVLPPRDPLSERGRGLHLIMAFSQGVEMEGGTLSMTFRLREATKAPLPSAPGIQKSGFRRSRR